MIVFSHFVKIDTKEKAMFGEKLKQFRKANKLGQVELAKIMNVANGTISMWESGQRTPDIDTIRSLAKLFHISINELIDDENPARIPVLGKIPAGIPIEMIEDVLDYEDISPDMLRGGKEYFALKVKGDSMSPKFLEGDILIVRKQDDCENGDFAIVAVNGYDATFKKVIKKENCIILQPLNPNFEPVIYDNDQIATLPVHILGVVVEIRRTI